jgi:hypothetical protein
MTTCGVISGMVVLLAERWNVDLRSAGFEYVLS